MADHAKRWDLDALSAIANVLIVRDCRSEYVRNDRGDSSRDDDSTARVAFDAITVTDSVRVLREADGRFHVPKGSPMSLIDAPLCGDDPLNQIPAEEAFVLGFELAMMLAAEIVPDPLGHHDISSVLNSMEERYIKHLRRHRDRYYDEVWKGRVAQAMAKVPA